MPATKTSRPNLPYAAEQLLNSNRYSSLGATPPRAEMLDADFNKLVDDHNSLADDVDGVAAGILPGSGDAENANLFPTTDGAGTISWTNVTTNNVADGAITNPKIGPLAVSTGNIADSAITGQKIANLTIPTGKIQDSAVTEGKIGPLSVTEGKIGALAVTEGKIGPLSVTEGKIGALAVTGPKIAATAITNDKIADNTITVNKMRSTGHVGVVAGRNTDYQYVECQMAAKTIPYVSSTNANVVTNYTLPQIWGEVAAGVLPREKIQYGNALWAAGSVQSSGAFRGGLNVASTTWDALHYWYVIKFTTAAPTLTCAVVTPLESWEQSYVKVFDNTNAEFKVSFSTYQGPPLQTYFNFIVFGY